MSRLILLAALASALPLFHAKAELPASFSKDIATIQAIGEEGDGNAEATIAWQSISKAEGNAIVPLLEAMKDSGPIAANLMRSAVEVISERELAAGKKLPAEALGAFVVNTDENPQARRFAFDLLAAVNLPEANKLVPGFINDPAVSLRRKAVAEVMIDAKAHLKKDDKETASTRFRKALDSARDIDQIQNITEALRDLGEEVDLPLHFGFLMDWKMIAPFDNSEREGFANVFPPEEKINLDAVYDGKEGRKAKWIDFTSKDEYGMVDFNKAFSVEKEVLGYAFTEFNAETARPAELRLGCKNAWKIWFNGELLFARDEYHRGARIDQYILPVELKEGPNTILIKACQNETDESWTVQWEFQLRVCDATGTAILAADRKGKED